MRILFWCESFWPAIGGSEVLAGALIEGLRDRGHEFEIVTPLLGSGDRESDEWEGVRVHRIAIDERAATEVDLSVILPARHRVARLKQRFRPDLVHVSLPGPSTLVHRFTQESAWNCPTLVSLHVPIEPTLVAFRRPAYETIRDADWVTACSRALRDHARWMVPEVRGRSSVIYNGLPIHAPAAPRVLESRVSGPFRVLCAGRLVDQKGFDTAISALKIIVTRGRDVRLRILGDGPLRGNLTSLAAQLGVEDSVEFAGWRQHSQVMAEIASADVVLVPSEWEPFGLVALQAAQCAIPVVASRVDGLPEVVEDGVTGLLADPGDVPGFAGHIERLMGDPDLARSIGVAASTRALNRFSLTDMLDAFESLYRRLARERPAASRGDA